jgi:hypothetical protein
MIASARIRPLILFLVAYLGYASSMVLGVGPIASIVCLVLMVGAVVWAGRLRDEVLRGAAGRAYQFAFWVGFLALYLETAFSRLPMLRGWWPLWTAPLLAWVLAYGWSLWRLR